MRQCFADCMRQQAPLLGLATVVGFLTGLIATGGNVPVALGVAGLSLGTTSLAVVSFCVASCLDQHST